MRRITPNSFALLAAYRSANARSAWLSFDIVEREPRLCGQILAVA
jgi:hypothetical protein